VCFGVKLDKLLLDSHKRVEKTRKKISKKTKNFSLSSVLFVLKYLVTFISSLLLFREKKKKLKKKKKKKEKTRRTQKNHKEPPHLFFSNNHKTRTNATKVMRLKDEDY
jgi:hypothetical protein